MNAHPISQTRILQATSSLHTIGDDVCLSCRREFLATLDLTKCCIPDHGGVAIAEGLQEGNVLLKTLILSSNEIGDGTARAFGKLFECNHTLLYLDLSWNSIRQPGAEALSRGLQSNATLQHLNLSWNGLESKGVVYLGEMLQVNLGLKYLDLSSTRVGPDACLVLAEGIKVQQRSAHKIFWYTNVQRMCFPIQFTL